MKLTCSICGGPLTYAGKGAHPELHKVCGALSNDVCRVERALRAAWNLEGAAQGVRKSALRAWLVGEFWRMANEITASAIQRKPAPTPAERLNRVISSLQRTTKGRAALHAAGIQL